jgi:two-component sensor histidine kinase
MGRTYQIAQRVRFAIVAVGAIFTALWIAMLVWLFQVETQNSRQALVYSAQTIVTAVDAQIERYAAVGRVLAVAFTSTDPDVASLERQARRIALGLTDSWLLFSDADGQQLFNTLVPAGGPTATRNENAIAAGRRACELGTEQIADVGSGPAVGKAVTSVNFPIHINGTCYVLAVVFYANVFDKNMEGLPEGWLAGVIDSRGDYVTRSYRSEQIVGQPASIGWRNNMHRQGVFEFKSREGDDLIDANEPSPRTGWVAGVAVRASVFYAPLRRSIVIAGLAGAGAVLLSLFIVGALGRRVGDALAVVKRAAISLRDQQVVEERTGERDLDAILDTLSETSRQLATHENQMQLATSEVMHRSKNILMIVISMARFIARSATNTNNFIERFEQRLHALSTSQDLLIDNQWRETSLRQIALSQIALLAEGRFRLEGPDVVVSANSVQPLSMIFHELATNAVKHGSLSSPKGQVQLTWSIASEPDENLRIDFVWREHSGPQIAPAQRTGFGNTVISESVRSLNGNASFDYASGALTCTFDVQLLSAKTFRMNTASAAS